MARYVRRMSTPQQVQELIDGLSRDIFDTYQGVGSHRSTYDAAGSAAASEVLARMLLRRGWRYVGGEPPERWNRVGELPYCPNGNPLCFDPDAHDRPCPLT
jgi:hypothetical protein